MKSFLTYPKDNFEKTLGTYIEKGIDYIKKSQVKGINRQDFEQNVREFSYWRDEVEEFLKQSFDNPNNEYLQDFVNAGLMTTEALSASLHGLNPDSFEFRLKFFAPKAAAKVDVLVKLSNKLKFIPIKLNDINIETTMTENFPKKIFISHSSKDKDIVEKVIDIIETIGVTSDNIFCTSFEGYGVKLGANFLEVIKEKLNSNILVLFILSENFYSSIVSICEMGATWVKTNRHIPILIPPFDYNDIQGVIPNTQGMKVNEKDKFNTLKETIEEFFDLTPINGTKWERKRNNIIKEIEEIILK